MFIITVSYYVNGSWHFFVFWVSSIRFTNANRKTIQPLNCIGYNYNCYLVYFCFFVQKNRDLILVCALSDYVFVGRFSFAFDDSSEIAKVIEKCIPVETNMLHVCCKLKADPMVFVVEFFSLHSMQMYITTRLNYLFPM